MKSLHTYLCCTWAILLAGCGPDKLVGPRENDSAPKAISDPQVTNIPGGADIRFLLPDDENLYYVRAEYELRPGVVKEARSSGYTDQLTVQGFPDTVEYEVKLYSVSRGEKQSEPVTVKIKPLTPPVKEAFQSMVVRETFGGIYVTFTNTEKANLAIGVLTTDSLGQMYEVETHYSAAEEGRFSVRGFEPQERRFALYVRDRWGNHSDTVETSLVPVFEQEINKDKFRVHNLPNDTYVQHCCGAGVQNVWDGIYNVADPVFHTKPITDNIPQWFTINMGAKAKLSRFKLYHRPTDAYVYRNGAPKRLKIFGSNEPANDGSWDSWTLLTEAESFKPSGQPVGTNTNEDIQYAGFEGEEFEFPDGLPPVQYLRVMVEETWGGVNYIYMAEMTFWGSEEE